MRRRPVDYYDSRIEKLKAAVKRLQAEKRIAILRQRENELATKRASQ
jgi:hypothetical protein